MCGRFSFGVSKEKVLAEYPKLQIGIEIKQNYNVAPTQFAYLISNKQPRVLQAYRWGLIPYWAKDEKASYNTINARSEEIFEKPSFRLPILKQRCIVLADSFYEWERQGTSKIPFRIVNKDESLLAMAGIWDKWLNAAGEEVYSFSIITTRPNKEMKPIHDRMPVLLPDRAAKAKWLTVATKESLTKIMQPVKDATLYPYSVSPRVNSVKSNTADLHLPYQAPPTLF